MRARRHKQATETGGICFDNIKYIYYLILIATVILIEKYQIEVKNIPGSGENSPLKRVY